VAVSQAGREAAAAESALAQEPQTIPPLTSSIHRTIPTHPAWTATGSCPRIHKTINRDKQISQLRKLPFLAKPVTRQLRGVCQSGYTVQATAQATSVPPTGVTRAFEGRTAQVSGKLHSPVFPLGSSNCRCQPIGQTLWQPALRTRTGLPLWGDSAARPIGPHL